LPRLDPDRLVFLDETWATTNMTRPHGRAPRGARLVAAVPHGHRHTTTNVRGLRSTAPVAPLVLDGAINGAAFRAYIEQMLAPTLAPGDIVIMDNLGSHKVGGVREASPTAAIIDSQSVKGAEKGGFDRPARLRWRQEDQGQKAPRPCRHAWPDAARGGAQRRSARP
jgi:hypothetical protein